MNRIFLTSGDGVLNGDYTPGDTYYSMSVHDVIENGILNFTFDLIEPSLPEHKHFLLSIYFNKSVKTVKSDSEGMIYRAIKIEDTYVAVIINHSMLFGPATIIQNPTNYEKNFEIEFSDGQIIRCWLGETYK